MTDQPDKKVEVKVEPAKADVKKAEAAKDSK